MFLLTIIYALLAIIHLLFSIIIIVTHTISQQNKTLHSCDRIALTEWCLQSIDIHLHQSEYKFTVLLLAFISSQYNIKYSPFLLKSVMMSEQNWLTGNNIACNTSKFLLIN